MKAVKPAAVVMAAAAVLVLCSALYVRSTVSGLVSLAESLPDTPSAETAAGAETVLRMLEDASPLLDLVVADPFLDNARMRAVSLRVRAEAGDAAGTAEARALLLDALRAISRPERMDIRSIM